MNQTDETEVIFKMGCVESSSWATRSDSNKYIKSILTETNQKILKTNEIEHKNKQQIVAQNDSNKNIKSILTETNQAILKTNEIIIEQNKQQSAAQNDSNKSISTETNQTILKTNEINIQQNKLQSVVKVEQIKKYKFLCLHGSATSGQILEYQTTPFCLSTNLEVKCIDAPYVADSEPDPNIKRIYSPPAFKYYEWINSKTNSKRQQLEKSVSLVVNELRRQNYDGILGFSQGALVVTSVLKYLEDNNMSNLVKCAILIGGVHERLYFINVTQYTVSLPNLHIIGEVDEHKQLSLELMQWYDSEKQQVLLHPEGHRIPTKSTGIYPKVVEWLQTVLEN